MTELRPRILVIDSERHFVDTVCRGLHLHGYSCRGVLDLEAALEALSHGVDLVITDLTVPGGPGCELIERLRQDWPALAAHAAYSLSPTDLRERECVPGGISRTPAEAFILASYV